LSKSVWIRLVQARGETAAGRFLLLRFLKESNREAEAAFVVSRKIGKAVVRNKMKRRLRACFRSQKRSFTAPGYYLFIARTISSEATFRQLEDDMAALVKHAARASQEIG